VPASDGVQIDRDNQHIVVRWQNVGYAFNLACPHQNTALGGVREPAGGVRRRAPRAAAAGA